MDLSVLFGEAAKLGFIVLLLLAVSLGLVKWVRSLLAASDARAAQDRQECLERERRLAERLNNVEDRQIGDYGRTLDRCAAALEMNARAIEKLTDKDTGLHLALVKGQQS